MATVALLDVNVLVALFTPAHVHHEIAHDWFADHRDAGWATCPLTENGFVRVVTRLPSTDPSIRPTTALDHLRRFCSGKTHRFWPDGVSLGDAALFRPEYIRGHQQVTDIYLLGLAKSMGGSLATFDAGVPLQAVVGATSQHVQVIAG